MCGIKDIKNVTKAEKCCLCRLTFVLCFVISVSLIIGGFFVPPTGVIDGSVLTAIGELMGGVTLVEFVINIPKYLDTGIKAKISHGQTTVAIAADEVKEEAQDL